MKKDAESFHEALYVSRCMGDRRDASYLLGCHERLPDSLTDICGKPSHTGDYGALLRRDGGANEPEAAVVADPDEINVGQSECAFCPSGVMLEIMGDLAMNFKKLRMSGRFSDNQGAVFSTYSVISSRVISELLRGRRR